MRFDAKFFLLSLLLAAIGSLPAHLYIWLELWRLVSASMGFVVIETLFSVVSFVFDVFIPFIVMYKISEGDSLESVYPSIIVSTFFGCWLGNVTTEIVDWIIGWIRSTGSFSYVYLPMMAWRIFQLAFSLVFFVSMSAILLAYYRRTVRKSRAENQLVR